MQSFNHQKSLNIKFILLIQLIMLGYLSKKIRRDFSLEKLRSKRCHFVRKHFLHPGKSFNSNIIKVIKGYRHGANSTLYIVGVDKKGSKLIKDNALPEDNICEHLSPYKLSATELIFKWTQNNVTSADIDINNSESYPVEAFFYLCDCKNKMSRRGGSFPFIGPKNQNKLKINAEVTLRHTDVNTKKFAGLKSGYHGADEKYILEFLILFLVLFLGLLGFGLSKIYKYFTKKEEMDYPILLAVGCIPMQVLSLTAKLGHNMFVLIFGDGLDFLEGLSRIWHMVGELSLSLFLVLLALGFGTVFDNVSTKELQPQLIISLCLVVLRYFLEIIGNFVNDHEDIYHVYQGWTGNLQLIINLFVFGWFMHNIKKSPLSRIPKYKGFKNVLTWLCSIYFLARPLLILFTELLDPKDRNLVATVSSFGAIFWVNLVLIIILTNKKGVYQSVSFSRHGMVLAEPTKDI